MNQCLSEVAVADLPHVGSLKTDFAHTLSNHNTTLNAAFRLLLCNIDAACLIIDRCAQVVFANPKAEYIMGQQDGIALRHDRIVFTRPSEANALQQVLNWPMSLIQPEQDVVIRVTRPSGKRPYQWYVYATFGQSQHVDQILFAIVVHDPDDRVQLNKEQLKKACGLTPTEANLAAELVNGFRITYIANEWGLSVHTVRTHLKNLLSKLSCHSQNELIAALRRYG
jgi:DNA-binding CsgD family transcriptional regulator